MIETVIIGRLSGAAALVGVESEGMGKGIVDIVSMLSISDVSAGTHQELCGG
jgi:hypothetical protein